jgi:hypothetical protein
MKSANIRNYTTENLSLYLMEAFMEDSSSNISLLLRWSRNKGYKNCKLQKDTLYLGGREWVELYLYILSVPA